MAKTARLDICYLENIYTIEDELNIDVDKHVLAMFLN